LKSIKGPKHLWLSCEPLLESLVPTMTVTQLTGIDWVVCGAESGHQRRSFSKNWARLLMYECKLAVVPFFYKQSSGHLPGTDPYLEGKQHYNFPDGIAPLKYREVVEPESGPVQMAMFSDTKGGE
jgi:protein gp37